MQCIEYDIAMAGLDLFREVLRLKLHAHGIIALGFQCIQYRCARLAGNRGFRRRSAHNDNNFLLIHSDSLLSGFQGSSYFFSIAASSSPVL